MVKKRYYEYIALLTIILVTVSIISIGLGAVQISPINIIKMFYQQLTGDGVMSGHYRIITQIRLPRILLSLLLGMALAGSGVIFQSCFKNPMADPYVLGVSSGAALGATIMIVLFNSTTILGVSMVSLGAFVTAIVTVVLVFRLASGNGKMNNLTVLLAGIAINFFLSSMVSLIMTLNRDKLESIMFWTMGGVNSASWGKVVILLFAVVFQFIILMVYAKDMNTLLMGEESAQNLGVDVDRVRMILLISASLTTAVAVASCGIIGFVGLIVPHAVRLVSGPNHKYLSPLTLLAGGIFVVIADTVARIVIVPAEIPLGVMTSILGAPYFLYLLKRNIKLT